ncbi:MAG: SocA family protein [Pseudomonadota bacterium]|nr:SocA family protein [Pseudomonadota bacterium]
MQNLFSEKKAAQAAAYFLFRANGRLAVLKLMKLLYLAERLSYERYGEPIIGDALVSMDHGPVLSQTLNRINGMTQSDEEGWDKWVSNREQHDVALRDSGLIRTPEQDLLELSNADLGILNEIWNSFGHLDKYAIRDYTHDHCPEWQDPCGSSNPITLQCLFQALEYNNEQSCELINRLEESKSLNSVFSPLI